MRYFIIIILLLLVGCSSEQSKVEIPEISPQSQTQPTTRIITVACSFPAKSAAGAFIEEFAQELAQATENELTVLVYHEGFLGSNERLSQLIGAGELDFALLDFEPDDPLKKLFETPFLFNDETIVSAVDILNETDPAKSTFSVLKYINCGSVGLETEIQHETIESILPGDENSDLPIIETNIYAGDFSYDYFADIDYRYDIQYFCMSNDSGIMFDELQLVNNAIEAAIETNQQEYTVYDAPDNIQTYRPANYENYLENLPSAAEMLYEDENLLQAAQIFDNLLEF